MGKRKHIGKSERNAGKGGIDGTMMENEGNGENDVKMMGKWWKMRKMVGKMGR